MTLRDKRQKEFADVWLKEKHGILNLCPRFGKIYTSINILKQLKPKTILIAYPDNKIKEYGAANPTFTLTYSGFKNSETKSVHFLLTIYSS